jgi:protoporphyrinogen/coproporphyrinogen III oxidase
MGKVVVIGAGISGLATAWRLHRNGIDVVVLERDADPGGTMKTILDGEWLIESGPNSALETTPFFKQIFEEVGIAGAMRYANEASDKRYIMRGGKLHVLPMSPGAFFSTDLWTFGGKLRLLKEPFVGRADKEETIAEFVERRLGREFLDYAINPFVAGVYAGNPEQLSVCAAFPKLYALEEKYGGLIKGMIGGRRERKQRAERAKDRAKMFSFDRGMGVFPAAIAARLGERVKCNCVVDRVEQSASRNGSGTAWTISFSQNGSRHSIGADVVIISTPANAAAQLLGSISSSLASRLEKIYYPPVVEVFLGYQLNQIGMPLDGFGYLIPAVEKRSILGTIWSSSLFAGRAPEGHVALTTFLGGSRQPELTKKNDADVTALVHGEISRIMQVTGSPVYTHINRWEKAIPQYNLGYAGIVTAIEECEKGNPGLYLCSNFRGGIAVGDCVMNAERTAEAVLAHLKNVTQVHSTT